jgi:DNA-binding LacI/PurR family transcriptional regulator
MTKVNTILKGRGYRPIRRTKLQETCGQLADLAETLGPDAKLPTVIQLRDQLGVSVATLNSALTELEAQRVIRRKHGVGIYVSPRIRQRTVCLICDPSFFRVSGASPFWNLFVDRVRQRAEAEREEFSFHFTADDPTVMAGEASSSPLQSALVNDITNGRVDGILCVGVLEPTMEWIDAHQIPIVAFAGPGPYIVGIDSHEMIRLGVKALAEKGCRRIAYWSPVAPYRASPQNLPLNPKKLEVFARSLSAASLPLYPELIEQNEALATLPTYHTQSHQEQGYNLVMKIFGPESDPRTRPDGILSADDMQTQGALTALQRLGIRVGEEVQIATHANVGSPALLGWENDIILIEVDPSEIVHQMFSKLERLMEGITPNQKIYEVTPRLRGT